MQFNLVKYTSSIPLRAKIATFFKFRSNPAAKRRTNECGHEFSDWAQPLDWMVQNLLGAAPLMDGHREAQQRMSNNHLNWLRDVALLVVKAGRAGELLRANHLFDLMVGHDIDIPGVSKEVDLEDRAVRKKAHQAIGHVMKQYFASADEIWIDNLRFERSRGTDEKYRDFPNIESRRLRKV